MGGRHARPPHPLLERVAAVSGCSVSIHLIATCLHSTRPIHRPEWGMYILQKGSNGMFFQ